MNDNTTSTAHPRRSLRLLWVAFGVIAFGLLMGYREDFALSWQRALIAAAASGILVLSISQFRKAR